MIPLHIKALHPHSALSPYQQSLLLYDLPAALSQVYLIDSSLTLPTNAARILGFPLPRPHWCRLVLRSTASIVRRETMIGKPRLNLVLLIFLVVFTQQKGRILLTEGAGGDGFITTSGVHFMLNGSPFYANGLNAYWLMFFGSDPSRRSKVSAAFQEAASEGLTIARTWAFSDGGYSPLQYSPGSYNEQMFQVKN